DFNAEDYDDALRAVEELRQAAEREPALLRGLYAFARVSHYLAGSAGDFAAEVCESLKGLVTDERGPLASDPRRTSMKNFPAVLDDAAVKFRILKGRAGVEEE